MRDAPPRRASRGRPRYGQLEAATKARAREAALKDEALDRVAALTSQLDAEKSTCEQLRKELAEVLGTARASEADAESRHAEEKASLEQAHEARIAQLQTELA